MKYKIIGLIVVVLLISFAVSTKAKAEEVYAGEYRFLDQVTFDTRPRFNNNTLLVGKSAEAIWVETDASLDNARWSVTAASEAFLFKLFDNQNSNVHVWMRLERTTTNPDSIKFSMKHQGNQPTHIFENISVEVEPKVIVRHNPPNGVPVDTHVTHSSGDTGGSGSAGTGKQYVELIVDGVKYKILHDGIVGQ